MMSKQYTFQIAEVEQTIAWGETLARMLAAGDLVMLNGGLGAGKTTLTQGIGFGLGIKERISSPTFIVARVHAPGEKGIPLIHADAYRITDLEDLETLDLDSSLSQSVTVIEWGQGKVEGLSEDRLEISVIRPQGSQVIPADGVIDLENLDDGQRTIILSPHGDRWADICWEQVFSAFPCLVTDR